MRNRREALLTVTNELLRILLTALLVAFFITIINKPKTENVPQPRIEKMLSQFTDSLTV
jgi:uncharacterized membrane protein (DUF106 family)